MSFPVGGSRCMISLWWRGGQLEVRATSASPHKSVCGRAHGGASFPAHTLRIRWQQRKPGACTIKQECLEIASFLVATSAPPRWLAAGLVQRLPRAAAANARYTLPPQLGRGQRERCLQHNIGHVLLGAHFPILPTGRPFKSQPFSRLELLASFWKQEPQGRIARWWYAY